MREDIRWLPGAMIAIGGIITAVFMGYEMHEAQKLADETTTPFLRELAAFGNVLSGVLIFPLIAGLIAAILGILMTRYNFFGLAVATFFFGMFLLNWIGSILVIGGSVAAYFIWPSKDEEPPEEQRVAEDS